MSRTREGEPNVSGSGSKGTVQTHPPWFTWSLANPEKVLSRVVRSRFSCRAEVESCSRRRRRKKKHVNTLNPTNSSRLSVPAEETLHLHFVLWVLRLLRIRFVFDGLISARCRQLTTVIFLPFMKCCLVCFCAFMLVSLTNFFFCAILSWTPAIARCWTQSRFFKIGVNFSFDVFTKDLWGATVCKLYLDLICEWQRLYTLQAEQHEHQLHCKVSVRFQFAYDNGGGRVCVACRQT